MNRHTKLAFFIAPFLLVLGYIGADYFQSEQARNTLYQLVPVDHCDIYNHQCVLKTGELKITVYRQGKLTMINSTFPMEKAVVFVVDEHNQGQGFNLKMQQSPYYFGAETRLLEHLANKGDSQKVRVVIVAESGQYIAEFYSQTVR